MKWQGVFTALLTPMHGGAVDERALRALVRQQVEAGVQGLVACGSTGESAGLTDHEYDRVIHLVVDEALGRVPVIAGVGARSTHAQIHEARRAIAAGADGLLVVTPAYVKPTQVGLETHFRAVADAVDKPICLYNVPGRTGVDLQAETVIRLAAVPKIAAIKEATGNLERAAEIRRGAPESFALLSGDDPTLLPFLAIGGQGVITVLGNIAPKALVELVEAVDWGRLPLARTLFFRLLPLARTLFIESNPIPAKAAAFWMDILPSSELRLPLTPLSDGAADRLEAALLQAGLLARRRPLAPSTLGPGGADPGPGRTTTLDFD